MRFLRLWPGLALLPWLAGAEPAPAAGDPAAWDGPFIAEIIAAVRAASPELRAARSAAAALGARVPQERAWADPMFGFDAQRMGTRDFLAYSDLEWMLSQKFPVWGVNRLRARAAELEAQAGGASARQRELELVARARAAGFRLLALREQLALNAETTRLLERAVEQTRGRFLSGARMQADVLMAETALARNVEARRDLEQALGERTAELNRLMHRPPAAELPAPVAPAVPGWTFDFDAALAAAEGARPDYLAALQLAGAAAERVRAARRARLPEPELRLEARTVEGSGRAFEEYDTGIFFNVPWSGRKYRAAVDEARLEHQAAQHAADALRAALAAQVHDALRRAETTRHHWEVYTRRIVPLARQAVEAARAAYAAGGASITDLLAAERERAEAEAMTHHHLADHLTALAEIELVTGIPPARLATARRDAPADASAAHHPAP